MSQCPAKNLLLTEYLFKSSENTPKQASLFQWHWETTETLTKENTRLKYVQDAPQFKLSVHTRETKQSFTAQCRN